MDPLIHVAKYLPPGEIADRHVERALGGLIDEMQPGWRSVVDTMFFLPNLTVTHAE